MAKSVIAMLVMLVLLAGALIIPITQMSRWDPALKEAEQQRRNAEDAAATAPLAINGNPQPVTVLENAGQLQESFNADQGRSRLLAVLAPSDESCRQAALALQEALLAANPELDIAVYVVWIERGGTDTYESAREASSLLPDGRASQFYGSDNAAAYIADIMGYPGESAWNIMLLYDAEAVWEPELPQPGWYVHQLGPGHWLGDGNFAAGNDLRNALSARAAELTGWSF
jgi:hypothetical protein